MSKFYSIFVFLLFFTEVLVLNITELDYGTEEVDLEAKKAEITTDIFRPYKYSPRQIFAVNISLKAYEIVCWYEHAKRFPPSPTFSDFPGCLSDGRLVFRTVLEKISCKLDHTKVPGTFGQDIKEPLKKHLPIHYLMECHDFLDEPVDMYEDGDDINESEDLEDQRYETYELKGFAHCLISKMKKKYGHGDVTKAIHDLKEYWKGSKSWQQILLDRENLMRNRHGVGHLRLQKDLSDSAQNWANEIGQRCSLHHGKTYKAFQGIVQLRSKEYRGLKGYRGENKIEIEQVIGKVEAGYFALNSWYDEIKNYDFQKNNPDQYKDKVGAFTQSVWNKTEYVGYGYSVNEKCDKFRVRVVAHYYPGGNTQGYFAENVFPPKY